MAFETSILQNGEWTTRTLDVNAVLRHYDQQDQDANANAVEIETGPVLGLLTQTVIRSPVVHWILPIKLRDTEKTDIAFVGDDFIQIKELRSDGNLWDVVRKENFGARIRNSCVLGSPKAFLRDPKQQSTHIKIEDDRPDDMDIDTNGSPPAHSPSPSQVIVLQLDSGDSVFLMPHQSATGSLAFISSIHRVSRTMLKLQPGTHLVVDPSSRYMVIGCSEGVFAIYALRSRASLQEQYSRQESLHYVETERHIYLQGVILKMEFLYASSDDEEHIILLVLMIRKGKTRMFLYDWETGSDLRDVRPHSRRGHLLEKAHQSPLLIIPLMIKSAFILVSATTISICRDILHGSPRFIDINDRIDPPTTLFHGTGTPLWTSWARPVRLPHYTARHDDIYITREDGFLKFIETDCSEEDLVKTEMNIGLLRYNCGPALACLDYIKPNDTSADLLVTSGDSCAGAAYLIEARKAPIFTEYIQNWSPCHDLVTDQANREHRKPCLSTKIEHFQQPDRIFTCAGKGANGTITELRHGHEASVGLEISYDAQIMDVWVLSPKSDKAYNDEGSLFLLSLGDRSSVLYLSSDATEIVELEPEVTEFDLQSRTIVASKHGSYMIQVTEHSVVFMSGLECRKVLKDELLLVYEDGSLIGSGENVDLAVIYGGTVLFTTQIGKISYLQIMDFEVTNRIAHHSPKHQLVRNLSRYSPNGTCLTMGSLVQGIFIVTGEYDKGSLRLVFQALRAANCRVLDIPPSDDVHQNRMEAIVSIVVVPDSDGYFIVVCGTRNGLLITLEVTEDSFQIVRSWYDRIGLTSVAVTRDEYSGAKNVVFVNCGLEIYILMVPTITVFSSGRARRIERKISQIFLTDAQKPITKQPAINSIARLQPNLFGETDSGIILISGSQIRLADLSILSKAIPRHMPVEASPSRILYSRHLGCLVVAASENGKSTLLFIDPESGEDLSSPVDKKNGTPVNFVSGLGNLNERVFRLIEWPYVKGGKMWVFIIVCTNKGRIVIISTHNGEPVPSKSNYDERQGRKITYWTLHKAKREKPVYSVAGFNEGLIYCSGNTLHCEILDMVEKRFKQVAQYVLPSPAINLAWNDGRIYALTAAHSLEILRLDGEATLDAASVDNSRHQIVRTHGDQVTRNALHYQRLIGGLESTIELISDKSCSVVGLRATHNTRTDTLDTIFEAQLSCSVLRFCSGTSRPTWERTLAPKADMETFRVFGLNSGYEEAFGASIDGSLISFSIIGIQAWRFLRFLVNLAKKSPKVCEFTWTQDEFSLEPAQNPKIMMHVDGDILRRCLDDGSLHELLQTGQKTDEAVAIQAKFGELVRGLHREELHENADVNVLIEQAYKELEYLLRPVL